MKHYILAAAAAALFASSVQAALPDTPRDKPTCDLVGAIASAVAELHGAGFTHPEARQRVLSTIRSSLPAHAGMPVWVRGVIDTSWKAQTSAPNMPPSRAGTVMRQICLAP